MDDIAKLAGISDKKAELLVNFRKEHGSFKSWDDLKDIPGFSGGILDKIKSHCSLDGE